MCANASDLNNVAPVFIKLGAQEVCTFFTHSDRCGSALLRSSLNAQEITDHFYNNISALIVSKLKHLIMCTGKSND